jgi:hypothetical protein
VSANRKQWKALLSCSKISSIKALLSSFENPAYWRIVQGDAHTLWYGPRKFGESQHQNQGDRGFQYLFRIGGLEFNAFSRKNAQSMSLVSTSDFAFSN